tara:strand:+ start:5853 stop:6530 length:678 start_codon:yes stop_codon:yes gene_type:complete
MWDILLSALIFTLGLVGGIWAGVLMEPSVPEGEMTISELLSLSFTILGGGAGFIATIFALYVYHQWRAQKRNDTIYSTKVVLIKHICAIVVYAGNMLVARANPNTTKVNEHRVNLIKTMSEIAVESDILKSLSTDSEELANELMLLNAISAEILNMRLWPEEDHIDKIYIASTHEWSCERVKSFFDLVDHDLGGDLGGRCYKLENIKAEINTIAEGTKNTLRNGL